jgi:hypothetical protein
MSERTECERLRAINAELLEALKQIQSTHWLLAKSCGVDPEAQPSIIKAKAAIAKAKGHL